MLEIATTKSMTNSMNMPACSSTPIGLIRMKVQAMPKNRSSSKNRIRHERMFAVLGVSARNCRQVRTMMRWMTSAPPVHTPQISAPVHRPENTPMLTMSSSMTGDAETRFWANWRSSS